MVMRALPEAPRPATNAGRLFYNIGKVDPKDQRAVAEYPVFIMHVHIVAGCFGYGKSESAIIDLAMQLPAPHPVGWRYNRDPGTGP